MTAGQDFLAGERLTLGDIVFLNGRGLLMKARGGQGHVFTLPPGTVIDEATNTVTVPFSKGDTGD